MPVFVQPDIMVGGRGIRLGPSQPRAAVCGSMMQAALSAETHKDGAHPTIAAEP